MTGMSAECGQSAPSSPNGSICQERMFIVADLNDRLWVDSGRKLLGLSCRSSTACRLTGFARSGHQPARKRRWRQFKVRFLKLDMQESTPM